MRIRTMTRRNTGSWTPWWFNNGGSGQATGVATISLMRSVLVLRGFEVTGSGPFVAFERRLVAG